MELKFKCETKLIKDINEVCQGYTHAEIIHALEFIKLKVLMEK